MTPPIPIPTITTPSPPPPISPGNSLSSELSEPSDYSEPSDSILSTPDLPTSSDRDSSIIPVTCPTSPPLIQDLPYQDPMDTDKPPPSKISRKRLYIKNSEPESYIQDLQSPPKKVPKLPPKGFLPVPPPIPPRPSSRYPGHTRLPPLHFSYKNFEKGGVL